MRIQQTILNIHKILRKQTADANEYYQLKYTNKDLYIHDKYKTFSKITEYADKYIIHSDIKFVDVIYKQDYKYLSRYFGKIGNTSIFYKIYKKLLSISSKLKYFYSIWSHVYSHMRCYGSEKHSFHETKITQYLFKHNAFNINYYRKYIWNENIPGRLYDIRLLEKNYVQMPTELMLGHYSTNICQNSNKYSNKYIKYLYEGNDDSFIAYQQFNEHLTRSDLVCLALDSFNFSLLDYCMKFDELNFWDMTKYLCTSYNNPQYFKMFIEKYLYYIPSGIYKQYVYYHTKSNYKAKIQILDEFGFD